MEKRKTMALIELLNSSRLNFDDLKQYFQFREEQIPALEKRLSEQLCLSAQDRNLIVKIRPDYLDRSMDPETFILSGYDPVIKTVFIHKADQNFIFHEAVEIDRFVLGEYRMETRSL